MHTQTHTHTHTSIYIYTLNEFQDASGYAHEECACAHTHACMYTNARATTNVYTRACMHIVQFVGVYAYIRFIVCVYVFACVSTHTESYTPCAVLARTSADTHTHTHTHTHKIHTYIHTYIHTHTLTYELHETHLVQSWQERRHSFIHTYMCVCVYIYEIHETHL